MKEDSENLYANQEKNANLCVDENNIKGSIPIVSMDDIFGLNGVSYNNDNNNNNNNDIMNDIINDNLERGYNINSELSNMNIRVDNLESMIFEKKYLLKPPKLRRSIAGRFDENNYIKNDICKYMIYKEEHIELDELIERINKLEEKVLVDKKITICKEKIEKLEKIADEIMNEEIFEEN